MYKNILEHLNEAILLFNRDLRLIYVNPSAEILLEDSAKHLLGSSIRKLFKTSQSLLIDDLLQRLNAN